ncbi:MAG: ornithine--acyl-ACP N-acyltransferase OlsB [Ahrensia sp.]|nr:ornithine--acyl-ACP N-acyltransferase OlsB [Ahrensia sp.]|tara:strand:+ start:357 stop:1256 length:900 start_codon:yes stop_codon:yes gene_type:complete
MNIANTTALTDSNLHTAPSSAGCDAYGKTLLGEIGPLQARLIANAAELDAAQRLRFRVFGEEMGASFSQGSAATDRDEDRFDAVCDHLIVLDTTLPGDAPDQIVGTYRLLRDEVATRTGGFYSAGEFEIGTLVARHEEKKFLELGRSCVMSAYRSKRTIELLWQGIWAYCLRHDIDVMTGCASFPGATAQSHALALSFLYHHARAEGQWAIEAASSDSVSMDMMPVEAVDMKAALAATPPLIKGYLRLGAKFAGTAVIDRAFRTTDVMVILPVSTISERYVRYYGADAGRFAPGDKTSS